MKHIFDAGDCRVAALNISDVTLNKTEASEPARADPGTHLIQVFQMTRREVVKPDHSLFKKQKCFEQM